MKSIFQEFSKRQIYQFIESFHFGCVCLYMCARLCICQVSWSLWSVTGWFFKCPPAPLPLPVQYQNETITKSQPEVPFHEILHLREPLVGLLSFFHFGTEQKTSKGQLQNTSCIKKVSCSYSWELRKLENQSEGHLMRCREQLKRLMLRYKKF